MLKILKSRKKKRVAVYVGIANAKEKTGISRHVIGLINSISKLAPDIEFYLYYQCNPWQTVNLDWLHVKTNTIKRPVIFPFGWIESRPRLWWKYYLPFLMRLDKIDLFHGPNHSVPSKCSIPSVVTIHDIAYFFMPVHGKGFDDYLSKITLESMRNADRIIAVSRSTAEDCISQGISKEKIEVVYQGFDGKNEYEHKIEKDFDLISGAKKSEKYILSIGTLQPRKNLLSLLKAFQKVSHIIPHNLVLAGPPGSDKVEIERFISLNKLNHRVSIPGYISDEEKEEFFKNADIFVYPSIYEGFGLVILEAMSYGVPVITGNNSSLPEAAGHAAILVDVKSPDEIAEAIENVVNNVATRETLVEKGYDQIKRFSWNKCALETVEIYKKVLSKKLRH